MKIITMTREPTPSDILTSIERMLDTELEVYERNATDRRLLTRFYCQFPNVEIRQTAKTPFPVNTHGNGETIEDAIKDYVNKLSGNILAVTTAGHCREYLVPDMRCQCNGTCGHCTCKENAA